MVPPSKEVKILKQRPFSVSRVPLRLELIAMGIIGLPPVPVDHRHSESEFSGSPGLSLQLDTLKGCQWSPRLDSVSAYSRFLYSFWNGPHCTGVNYQKPPTNCTETQFAFPNALHLHLYGTNPVTMPYMYSTSTPPVPNERLDSYLRSHRSAENTPSAEYSEEGKHSRIGKRERDAQVRIEYDNATVGKSSNPITRVGGHRLPPAQSKGDWKLAYRNKGSENSLSASSHTAATTKEKMPQNSVQENGAITYNEDKREQGESENKS